MPYHDIIVQDREELFYLLSEAAEFEHSVMCTYLYAMWSLKRETAEGVTADELASIERWRRSLRQVALEEMLHLSLVNNMLAAIGGSPHLWRPQFPVPSGRFPTDLMMRLSPFSEATIDHFMYIERPEGIEMVDGAGFDHPAHHPRAARPELLSPTPQDYTSQGQLYHGVLRGLAKLVEQIGEARVFVGDDAAQVGAAEFSLPGLIKVNSLESARRAVEQIVLQGEGAPMHREGSHYQSFAKIKEDLAELRRARPTFEPARPVVVSPTLDKSEESADMAVITDSLTTKSVDLGNAIYALMIRVIAQIFSPAPLPPKLRGGFAGIAVDLMYSVSAVGGAVTRLPAGTSRPSATAGLTFDLPLSSGQLVQRCAAQILGERACELAGVSAKLEQAVSLPGVTKRLRSVADRFVELQVG